MCWSIAENIKTPDQIPWVYILDMIFRTMECAFGQFWLAFLAPSWLLVHLLTSRACESGKSLIQTSTSYQQPKHLFVISVTLILNSNHTVLRKKLILSQVKPGYLSRPSFSKLLSPCLIKFCNVEKYLTQPFNWSGWCYFFWLPGLGAKKNSQDLFPLRSVS